MKGLKQRAQREEKSVVGLKKKKTYLKQTIYRINILSIFTFRCKKGRADLSPA